MSRSLKELLMARRRIRDQLRAGRAELGKRLVSRRFPLIWSVCEKVTAELAVIRHLRDIFARKISGTAPDRSHLQVRRTQPCMGDPATANEASLGKFL